MQRLFTIERVGMLVLWVGTFSATFAYMRADVAEMKAKYMILDAKVAQQTTDLTDVRLTARALEERLIAIQRTLDRVENKLDK